MHLVAGDVSCGVKNRRCRRTCGRRRNLITTALRPRPEADDADHGSTRADPQRGHRRRTRFMSTEVHPKGPRPCGTRPAAVRARADRHSPEPGMVGDASAGAAGRPHGRCTVRAGPRRRPRRAHRRQPSQQHARTPSAGALVPHFRGVGARPQPHPPRSHRARGNGLRVASGHGRPVPGYGLSPAAAPPHGVGPGWFPPVLPARGVVEQDDPLQGASGQVGCRHPARSLHALHGAAGSRHRCGLPGGAGLG